MASKMMPADIAFGIAFALLAGIFAADLRWNILALTGAAALGGAIFLFFKQRLRFWKYLPIFLAMLVCGTLYCHFYINWKTGHANLPQGKQAEFSAIITDDPSESEKFLVLTAGAQQPFSGEVKIFAPLDEENFRYGDLIEVRGAVSPPRQPGDDPAVFPRSIKLIATGRGFWLREKLLGIKTAILEKFNENLGPNEAALLGGDTLGGTDGMSAELKDQMAASGTSYITTMYGYKIAAIIFIAESMICEYVARRVRFWLMLTIIALFTLMAGAPISAIRAAIMVSLTLIAKELGRLPSTRNSLTLTAAGMALADPAAMVQASFLLSFLSLLGIIYLGPALKAMLGWGDERLGALHWKEAVIISVAALVPIVPVIIAVFGSFSAAAFISNILIFPTVPIAMLFGYALAVTGFIAASIAFMVAKFAEAVLWLQLAVIKIFSALALPVPIRFDSAPPFIIYYAALIVFIYVYSAAKNKTPA